MTELVIPPGYVLLTTYMRHATMAHTALWSVGAKVRSAPYDQASTDAMFTVINTALKAQYDAEVTFLKTVALVGNDGPKLRFESSNTSVVGTHSALSTLPPNVALVVGKHTSFAGRQYRGRFYLPYPSTTDTNQDGSLTSSATTAWGGAIANLYTNMTTTGAHNVNELDILHAPPLVGSVPDPTPIGGFRLGAFVGTQRRRLVRV